MEENREQNDKETQSLENVDKDNLEEAELEDVLESVPPEHRKVFTFLTMIVAMVFFIFLVILLKDNPDVMEKIIYTVGGVVVGAFGGYGFGKNRNDE